MAKLLCGHFCKFPANAKLGDTFICPICEDTWTRVLDLDGCQYWDKE